MADEKAKDSGVEELDIEVEEVSGSAATVREEVHQEEGERAKRAEESQEEEDKPRDEG